MKPLLFITNGHGEDQVAVQIIQEIRSRRSDVEICAYPLIGNGERFERVKIPVLGPRREMPSGGFIHHNFRGLLTDIFKGGLIPNIFRHYRSLRKLRGKISKIIAVGDMIPVFAASIVGAPAIHVGINKSDYYEYAGYSYMGFEIAYLRKFVERVFTRDAITAERLSRQGVRASYVGNPMMDGIPVAEQRTPQHLKTVGFLPGTRAGDIQKNLEDFDQIARAIDNARPTGEKFTYFVACPPNGTHPPLPKIFSIADFNAVISNSDIIVGLSGTGNEQAAGCGKPIVAFPSRGQQYSLRYGKAQGQLLGDAITLTARDPHEIQKEILDILGNSDRYKKMSDGGRKRMGNPGASRQIAEGII